MSSVPAAPSLRPTGWMGLVPVATAQPPSDRLQSARSLSPGQPTRRQSGATTDRNPDGHRRGSRDSHADRRELKPSIMQSDPRMWRSPSPACTIHLDHVAAGIEPIACFRLARRREGQPWAEWVRRSGHAETDPGNGLVAGLPCAPRLVWLRATSPAEPIRFVSYAPPTAFLLHNGCPDPAAPIVDARELHAASPESGAIRRYDAAPTPGAGAHGDAPRREVRDWSWGAVRKRVLRARRGRPACCRAQRGRGEDERVPHRPALEVAAIVLLTACGR